MEVTAIQQRDNVSNYQSLRSLFEKNITVNSISEVLDTCNVSDQAQQISDQMVLKDYDVIGIEENGMVIGYVLRDDLGEGTCREYFRSFSPSELVSESTPLLQTLFIFKNTERLFIIEGNRITKVVTLADLQKPPIRMLLFGVISLLEMHLYRIINDYFHEDSWKKHLSDKRIQLAEELFLQRKARNEAIQLCDCLQLCDKRDIVLNEQPLRELLGIESKSKGKDFFKKLEILRNNLAHSQDLNTQNSWNEMITLIKQTENVLEQCEKF
ncbi:hypothetical protein J2Y03_004370 [Neobacillus niacini]|uniref:hypothetical protein n=1 Tax=Neobacillus niacini TaxID=86668 RepID=UPI00285F345F|nr:hypothetical protein [Neobacillus niacini]MDR7079312.1 hypothetical protein [Neobacillus niacini]